MAKIKSPIISTAQGSLGGTAWQTTGGSVRMIQRKRPSVHSNLPILMNGLGYSAESSSNKGGFAFFSQAWNTLSDADRASWEAIATAPETGKQMWMRWNAQFFYYATIIQTYAPPPPQAAQPLDLGAQHWTLDDDSSTYTLAIDLPGAIPTNPILAYTAGPFSPGRNTPPRRGWMYTESELSSDPPQLLLFFGNLSGQSAPRYGARQFLKISQQDPNSWTVGEQLVTCLPTPEL